MSEQVQDFSLDILSKAHDKYENIKEVFVNVEIDGEVKTFKVEVYKVFSPVGIKQCVKEYVSNLDVAKNVNPNGFGDVTEPYFLYLLIKHFTNIGEQMPSNFKEQLVSLKHMMNTTVLFQIILHFDENEINKIKEEIEFIMEAFEDNSKILDGIKKKAEDEVDNKDLLE